MHSEPRSVTVAAPARLHLGFLDLNGGLGRRFGGIGLAVDAPRTVVSLATAPEDTIIAADAAIAARARRVLARAREQLGLGQHYRIEVEAAIPAHAGLGSGTQLALAIGAGLARLSGREEATDRLGAATERGARSAIGMAAFAGGGLIVDGGRGPATITPPVLARADFPSDWRILLVLDPQHQGASGDRETEAFAALPEMSPADSGALCRLVLMQLLPGLAEHDLAAFGGALTTIQQIVGRHFAPAQGGSPWTSPAVGRAIARAGALGAVGLGQTSWGPTGIAFVESHAAAQGLYSTLVEDCRRDGLELMIVGGRNAGASISAPKNGQTGSHSGGRPR
jgi:beta-ribofuranosylaminobenzene 5'-phosphate synthase